MAEFIFGNKLGKRAQGNRLLRRLLWCADYAVIWCLVALFRLLPIDAASWLGERLGRWIGPTLKRHTALYRENLATALPDLDKQALDKLVVDAWGRAGRVLGEYPHLKTFMRDEERLDIVVRDPATRLHPCVVVTAHHCSWEVVGAAMARMDMPNACLYTPPTNPLLNRLLLAHRSALKCQLLHRDDAAKLLMKVIKDGVTAAMVMDRRVDTGKPVRFFGRDKMATTLPARLAQKFGLDLVPAQAERLGNARYRVTFHPPVKPRNPEADENARALDLIQQVHEHFEDWIRAEPGDWFCPQRIWPKPTRAKQGDTLGANGGASGEASRHAA